MLSPLSRFVKGHDAPLIFNARLSYHSFRRIASIIFAFFLGKTGLRLRHFGRIGRSQVDRVRPEAHADGRLDIGGRGLRRQCERQVLAAARHAAGHVQRVRPHRERNADALLVGQMAVGLAVQINAVACRDADRGAHAVDLQHSPAVVADRCAAFGAIAEACRVHDFAAGRAFDSFHHLWFICRKIKTDIDFSLLILL